MKRLAYLGTLFVSLFSSSLMAHDGHSAAAAGAQMDAFIYWIGGFHPMFLGFPIALITMTVVAEVLFSRRGENLYDHAARFMILSAAILSIPTVLFGLALGYGAAYPNPQADFFWWHRFVGLSTMALVIVTAYLREYNGRRAPYFTFLTASFLSVIVTGFLGGNLTFDVLEGTSLFFKTL